MSLLAEPAARRNPLPAPDRSATEAHRPPGREPAGAVDGWLGEVWLLAALVVLTLAAVFGLHRVFSDRAWVEPVLVTGLSAHALAVVVRRSRLPPVLAMFVGLAVVASVGATTALGTSVFHGFPHTTLQIVHDDVSQARSEFPTVVAPVPTSPGFELLAAWGAGVVAILGDWGTFRLRSAIQGAAPAVALFVVCAIFGGPAGRNLAVLVWLGALVAFLLVYHAATGHEGEAWFAGRRDHSPQRKVAAGLAIGTAAVLVAAGVTPALGGRDGHGVLGWRNGPGADGTRLVESPIVDLRTRIVQESNVPVFTVHSSVPSYWRLTSLNTFTGTIWESTDSYQSVHDRLPGVARPPRGTRKVTEDFHIQNLDSIWLPMAFDPEAVTGAGTVTYDPTSGSLLTGHATSNDLTYQVTSLQDLDALDASQLNAAGNPPRDARTTPYLQLPSGIPPAVVALAQRITAGKTTEYARALALQDYLLGPSFTYSTDPPSDGYSTSALATFLLDTRTGYCQQFAGAYAVMARIVGIPTRLAVGFATGTPAGNGVYHVTDADAHTWPEVYFPQYGWVPFEPTKGNFAIPGGDAYTGSTLGDTNANPVNTQPGPTTPTLPPKPTGAPTPVSGPATPLPGSGHHQGAAGVVGPLLLALAALVVMGLAWPLLILAGRRRRRAAERRRAPGGATGQVLLAWQAMGERLAWRGVARQPDETVVEYAGRAGAELSGRLARRGRTGLSASASTEELVALAQTVDRARFAGQALPAEAAEPAIDTATRVSDGLRGGAGWTLRVRWWLDPRLAWKAGTEPT